MSINLTYEYTTQNASQIFRFKYTSSNVRKQVTALRTCWRIQIMCSWLLYRHDCDTSHAKRLISNLSQGSETLAWNHMRYSFVRLGGLDRRRPLSSVVIVKSLAIHEHCTPLTMIVFIIVLFQSCYFHQRRRERNNSEYIKWIGERGGVELSRKNALKYCTDAWRPKWYNALTTHGNVRAI